MTTPQGWRDRAAGVLLASAAGDALGARYEFAHPEPGVPIDMIGGGAFAWDSGRVDRRHGDDPGHRPGDRYRRGPDQRNRTGRRRGRIRRVVRLAPQGHRQPDPRRAVRRRPDGRRDDRDRRPDRRPPGWQRVADADRTDRDRPPPDPDACVEAAARVGALTHDDERATQACQLRSYAIRHAVLSGTSDVVRGFLQRDAAADAFWGPLLDTAETGSPEDFSKNGWV